MKTSARTTGMFVLSLALSTGACLAQGQAFIKHGFEDGENGWQVMGTGGKVSRTSESADVK